MEVLEKLETASKEIESRELEEKLNKEKIDITLPGRKHLKGSIIR